MTKFSKKISSRAGQIMVESLVAICIITVGLLGIFSLLSNSLGINRDVAGQYVAAGLAAEGIELIKNMIDGNLIMGKPFNDGPCLNPGVHAIIFDDANSIGSICAGPDITGDYLVFDSNNGLYSYAGDVITGYKRSVTVEWPVPEQMKIKSIVTWTGHTGTSKIELEDNFFDWR